ncbi:PIG-L deacetylase family protein [Kiloniella litopenaei]|uniref:PIG-L deacetylase family protein n=1 Tax=Kiloniella litopenaei TaxID=1549748 RepID=UPI003BA8578D
MAFTGIKTACVIVAHADDEILGCGGTMARLSEQGAEVHVCFMTDGVGARGTIVEKLKKDREEMARKSNKIIGTQFISFASFPDNSMDSVPLLSIAQHIEKLISEHQPELIITHHHSDLNIDHQITYRSVMTACRPQPGHTVKTILSMEVPSATNWSQQSPSTQFQPNFFVDISKQKDKKLAALKAYDLEMRPFPHSRSYNAIEARNVLRGTDVGVPLAEAFQLVRHIQ